MFDSLLVLPVGVQFLTLGLLFFLYGCLPLLILALACLDVSLDGRKLHVAMVAHRAVASGPGPLALGAGQGFY